MPQLPDQPVALYGVPGNLANDKTRPGRNLLGTGEVVENEMIGCQATSASRDVPEFG